MRVNIVENPEPSLIHPEMMEGNRVYKVWYGDSSDLYCTLDNNSGENILCFDTHSGVIWSVDIDYLNGEGWMLEKSDLEITVTLAPSNYHVYASI